MRILIVGAGEVGYYVAERLSKQQHDVVSLWSRVAGSIRLSSRRQESSKRDCSWPSAASMK
jgi:ketopantoate reductase